MFKQVKQELITLTPKLAEDFLEDNDYFTQRQIRPAWVAELSKKITDGKFRTGEVAFSYYGGKLYMMNGQHQCSAVMTAQKSIPCLVEYFECETIIDLSDLFRQFDNLQRSISDYLSAEAYALKINWRKNVLSLTSSAATLLESGGQKFGWVSRSAASVRRTPHSPVVSKETRTTVLKRYIKEGTFLNNIFENGTVSNCSHLRRTAVVAAMFMTIEKNEADALLFWPAVRDGENLKQEMPQMRIREFLKLTIGRGGIAYSQKVTNHEVIYKTIAAWNAYRKGKSTSLRYFPDKNVPALK